MKKIKFTIKNKTLTVELRNENNSIRNINNTNYFNDEDLVFDTKYFKNHIELVAGFLNVIIKNESVNKCIVKDEILIIQTINLLDFIPNITELVIKPDISLTYEMHLAILKNDTLKKIDCFTIPPYLLERIDTTKSIEIITRNEVFFISNFIRINKLNSYSEVFYKKKIVIENELNDQDEKDLRTFLTVNNHLKVIYFEYITIDLIKKTISLLKEYDKKNIVISIKGNKTNLSYFQTLELYIKKNKFIKKNNIKFNIDYTKEYKIENFMNFVNFTTMKYILVIIILSCFIGYGINSYNLFKSSQEITDITNNLDDVLEDLEVDAPNIESTPLNPNPNINNPKPKPNYNAAYYKDYSKVVSVLKKTNPDTIGWLTVPNTNVNYPVVKTNNNSYYLKHDFNKNPNSMGWVFLDYRMDPDNLKQNTIIYGHNAKYNLMFSSLRNTLTSKWYRNPNNHYISFNTQNKEMTWQVFSVYKIKTTNDYLYSKFDTQEGFLKFVEKVKQRSVYNFKKNIKENDKILTLSTCQNAGKYRLVVHAVLIESK